LVGSSFGCVSYAGGRDARGRREELKYFAARVRLFLFPNHIDY
jgi:hypothetical protein